MKKFTHQFQVKTTLMAVAAFHGEIRSLGALTPPPFRVQFHRVESLAEGSVADFTMWLGPFPIRWTAVHTQVTLQGFTDTQQRGPFQTWQHKHSFQAVDENTTEVIDEIEANPGGLISWMMWLALPFLFAYRGWQTKRLSEKIEL